MPQLVGRNCVHCQQRIPSEIDGYFCPACGSPVHNDCARVVPGPRPRGCCGSCGAPAAVAAARARELRAQAEEERGREAMGLAAFGFMSVFGGVVMAVIALLRGDGPIRFVYAGGAVVVGLVLFAVALRQLPR